MINLLPPQQKKELLQGEKYKLILLLGILAILFLISLSLILISIKIYISGQVESQKILVDLEEKEFKKSGVQNFEKEISLINENLSKLSSFYENQPNFTELLEKISKILPEGMYFTAISLKPISSSNKFQISLSGYSPTRDILSELKKKLEADPTFKEISFPPSNWVESQEIDFSATFKLNP